MSRGQLIRLLRGDEPVPAFAARLGVSPAHVYSLETSRRRPGPDVLALLLDLFMERLLGGSLPGEIWAEFGLDEPVGCADPDDLARHVSLFMEHMTGLPQRSAA